MQYIINDIGVDASCLKQFGVEVLEVGEMTQELRQWEGWSRLSPDTTRIILPGNGALDVQKALGVDWLAKWPTGNIPATRFWWPGSTPESVVGMVIDGFDLLAEDVVIAAALPASKVDSDSWTTQRCAKMSPCARRHRERASPASPSHPLPREGGAGGRPTLPVAPAHPAPPTSAPGPRSRDRGGRCARSGFRPAPPGRRSPGWPRRADR